MLGGMLHGGDDLQTGLDALDMRLKRSLGEGGKASSTYRKVGGAAKVPKSSTWRVIEAEWEDLGNRSDSNEER